MNKVNHYSVSEKHKQALLQKQIKELVQSERRLYETKASLDHQVDRVTSLNEFGLAVLKAKNIKDIFQYGLLFLRANYAYKTVQGSELNFQSGKMESTVYHEGLDRCQTTKTSMQGLSSSTLKKKFFFKFSTIPTSLKSTFVLLSKQLFSLAINEDYSMVEYENILMISGYIQKSNKTYVLMLHTPNQELLSTQERFYIKKEELFLKLFANYFFSAIHNMSYQEELQSFNIKLELGIKQRTEELKNMSERFKNIFESSAIPIWELDCENFVVRRDKTKNLSEADFKLELKKIKIVNVNSASFKIFEVKTMAALKKLFIIMALSIGSKGMADVFDVLNKGKQHPGCQVSITRGRKKTLILNVGFSIESSTKASREKKVLMTLFDVTELVMAENRVAYLAEHDSLTGLYNRALLIPFLKNAMSRYDRTGKYIALLYLDLDKFKFINDSYGHDVGDILLQRLAKRLLQSSRKDDLIVRLGGDEFAIIVHDLDHPQNAGTIATTLLAHIDKPFIINDVKHHVTASIGIIYFPVESDEVVGANDLIKMADIALFNAKEKGRNCFSFFNEEMNRIFQNAIQLEHELQEVIERNELVVYYQPIVDFQDNSVCGLEALIRWNYKKKEILEPDKFLPVLEKTGLILKVGDWILRRVCRDFKTLKKLTPYQKSDFFVSINISAIQLIDPDFLNRFFQIVKEMKMPEEHLVVEVTESIFIQELSTILPLLKTMQEHHIKIAIDDFGTGYSSLGYLASLPFDYLKIDQSFLKKAQKSEKFKRVLMSILLLAKSIDTMVIVEGAETEDQIKFLKDNHMGLIQGYYYGKPKPL